MWQYFNNNPLERRVGDCSVRAVAKALDISWEEAYAKIAAAGFAMGDVMSSDSVWGAVLRQNGFYRSIIPNQCADCFTAEDFCKEHPEGLFVLGFGGHVATVEDGVIYDTWDSSGEYPVYYYFQKEKKK